MYLIRTVQIFAHLKFVPLKFLLTFSMDHHTDMKVACMCGDYLQCFTAIDLMEKYNSEKGVSCVSCDKIFKTQYDLLYACSKLGNSKYHRNGYGFCAKCTEMIFEQEKNNDNNPQLYELVYQRFINRMNYMQKHHAKINPNTTHLLIQLVHQKVNNLYYSNHKSQFSNKVEYEKHIESFACNILDCEKQYEWINNQISIINNNDQKQLAKLCNYCTVYCYITYRLFWEYYMDLKEYYYKFKQQQTIFYNKLNATTKNDLYYCTCGRLRLKLYACDALPPSGNRVVYCGICRESIEYDTSKTKTIYECEYGGKGCTWRICSKCIYYTHYLQRIPSVNLGKEFNKNDDSDYSQNDALNENIMRFFAILFDKIDSKSTQSDDVFRQVFENCRTTLNDFLSCLTDDKKRIIRKRMYILLQKRVQNEALNHKIVHSQFSMKVDNNVLDLLGKRSTQIIEFSAKDETLITVNPRQYLLKNEYTHDNEMDSQTLSMIHQLLNTFDCLDENDDASDNIELSFGIQYSYGDSFYFLVIAKSVPFFIRHFYLTVYLFINELNWCLQSYAFIKKVTGNIIHSFPVSELKKLETMNISVFTKITEIRCCTSTIGPGYLGKIKTVYKNTRLKSIDDFEKAKTNYNSYYDYHLERLRNQNVVNGKRRCWYELNISGQELELFWKGNKISSDIIVYNIFNDIDKKQEPLFNDINYMISVQKSGNLKDVWKISVNITAPPFLGASTLGDCFIPQVRFYRGQTNWNDWDNNGEFHSDLLKTNGHSAFDIYFSLEFRCINNESWQTISSFNELRILKQKFKQNFDEKLCTNISEYKHNDRKQLHSLTICDKDKKIKFDKDKEMYGEVFDLFPFPVFDYLINHWIFINTDIYIPPEVVKLIKMFTPNIFKSESFKMYLSILNDNGYVRIKFNAVTALRYKKQMKFTTEYWIPEMLYHRDGVSASFQGKTLGYTTNVLVSKLKCIDCFHIHVGFTILHSNQDIINERKQFWNKFLEKRNVVLKRNERHKLTLTTSINVSEKLLEGLFEGKSNEWNICPGMCCDITPQSSMSSVTKISLVPSFSNQNNHFYHGIDFTANTYVSRILFDLHFIRDEMMDHLERYEMGMNQGSGRGLKCSSQYGHVDMNQMEYTSFNIKVVVHIIKLFDKDSKEISLKKYKCSLCDVAYYQLKEYQQHLQCVEHIFKVSMDYTQKDWHQMNSF
eukprot:12368_1